MIDVAVDIGNSRIKWGRCEGGRVVASAALPPEDSAAWDRLAAEWQLDAAPRRWAVAGVHPPRRDRFLGWLERTGDEVQVLTHAAQLPLVVRVPEPDKVGIDRLLAAVGANAQRALGSG